MNKFDRKAKATKYLDFLLSAVLGDDCGAAVPAAQEVGANKGRRDARTINLAESLIFLAQRLVLTEKGGKSRHGLIDRPDRVCLELAVRISAILSRRRPRGSGVVAAVKACVWKGVGRGF